MKDMMVETEPAKPAAEPTAATERKKRFLVLNYGETYHDFGPQNTVVHYWKDNYCADEQTAGVIGYVEEETTLFSHSGDFKLGRGMYFASKGPVRLLSGSGMALVTSDHKPQFTIGGPFEPWGRLKYIDGCTDNLLISPVKFGNPCLNALYFPPNINQTQHTHPSLRAGLVVAGKGMCHTPYRDTELKPGVCFIIETESLHYFSTPPDDQMIVIAYHPDSDMGPSDEDHPMVNRTIVEGVSARYIDEIRTK